MQNHIRIPALSVDIFKDEDQNFLTEKFLNEHKEIFDVTSNLLSVLEGDDESLNEELSLILDDFESQNCIDFYNGDNIAIEMLNIRLSAKMSGNELIQILNEKYPIIGLIVDSDEDIMQSRIDNFTQVAYGEYYPLYCQPKKEVIKHFVEVCSDVAFIDIGGNYFAYLTGCGSDLSRQIAYAYLMVDDCVPHNIMNESTCLKNLPIQMVEKFEEFFEKNKVTFSVLR